MSSARLNITREEAAARAAALTVDAYEVALDLTRGAERFAVTSTVTFAAAEDAVGTGTWIDWVAGQAPRSATLNGQPLDVSAHDEPRSPEQKRRAMSWAQRLKRVFSIDVTTCAHCGGAVRIVASIEDPKAIRAILAHFEKHGALEQAHYRPAARAPPPAA